MNELNIVKEFCRTYNQNLLKSLSTETKEFMVRMARRAYYTLNPNTNLQAARLILEELDTFEITDILYKNINKSRMSYRGDLIQNFVALMFLLREHRHACTIVATSLADQLYSLTWECFGGRRSLLRSFDFELLFNNCKNDEKVRFIIIPIVMNYNKPCSRIQQLNSHANFLIYDKQSGIIDRFEPNGVVAQGENWFETDKLDIELKKLFEEEMGVKKYMSPIDVCPYRSFQSLQASEKLGFSGSCLVWSYWYIDMRLTYPDIPPDILQKLLLEKLRKEPYSMTQFIKSYANYLDKMTIKIRKETRGFSNDLLDEYLINKMSETLMNRL